MSAAALAAAAIAVLAAPPALETPARIAVIVQGDGAEAGRIQADVEKELNLQQAAVKSAAELSQKLALPAETPAPAPAINLENAKTKIAEAEAAFLRGEYDVAKASADDAKRLIAAMPTESAFDERVLASLWHAASVQQTDPAAAKVEIATLLNDVTPQPKVSTDVFPPDFVGFVETERQGLKTANIRLTDLPAAAQIWVNGRKIDTNPFTIVLNPSKPNVVTVRAQGYRTAIFQLPATPPPSARVPLALALPPEQDGAVRAAFAGKSDERVHRALAQLASATPPVTALLLLQARGKAPPNALLWKDNKFQPLSAPSSAALATAVMDTFRKPGQQGLSIVTTGAMEVSQWTRELGGDREVYALPLTGTGPRISADISWNMLLAATEISYIQYLTPIEASVTGGGDGGKTVPTRGGSALRASAGVGVNRAFGDFSAGALVGARFEQYSTKVLKVEATEGGGGPAPIIGPHTWGGPQAELRGGWKSGPIGVVAGVGAVFASTYTEGEKNMSGRSPATGAAPFWRLGGTWAATEKLAVGALYAGESRSTKFKGPPALVQDPPQQDLVLDDFLTTLAVTAAYRF